MKKRNPFLIGCLAIIVIFLCCGATVGGYFGYSVYQGEKCYSDAFDAYVEKWEAACKLEGTFVAAGEDCFLPQEVSVPLNNQLDIDELQCDSDFYGF